MFIVVSCSKLANKNIEIADFENYLPNFKITSIEKKNDIIVLSYEYFPDLNSVGYSSYGVFKGNLYTVKNADSYTPILNITTDMDKAFGEKLHLEEINEDSNKIHLKYYIEPYGNLASCFGYVEITLSYSSGGYSVVDYSCDIESRFNVDEETGAESPSKNGKKIYKKNLSQEDFMSILNTKDLGF